MNAAAPKRFASWTKDRSAAAGIRSLIEIGTQRPVRESNQSDVVLRLSQRPESASVGIRRAMMRAYACASVIDALNAIAPASVIASGLARQ